MSDDGKLQWQTISSERGPELPLFKVRYDRVRHPSSSAEFSRIVLETPAWVNVVAVTGNGEIVMVEQYRFGVSALTIEPVGGVVDPDESPREAAERELLEESGFGGGRWRSLGTVQANPAFHDNLCHLWLAEDVERLRDPTPDPGEAIRVHLMSLDEVKEAIGDGRLQHPLGLAALSRVFPLWDDLRD